MEGNGKLADPAKAEALVREICGAAERIGCNLLETAMAAKAVNEAAKAAVGDKAAKAPDADFGAASE